uniref:Myosin-11 n=1 Tax=Phallusia mammillata TaxID=59560 RepID=A0A6F9DKZ4_9ASCI|nr:myosin-11 [Phallusia mammillata]
MTHYEKAFKQLQNEKQELNEELANIQEKYIQTQSQLKMDNPENETQRFEALHDEIKSLKVTLGELTKENTSINCKLKESCNELQQAKEELFKLQEVKCDLQITIAESDIFSQALQEHIDELEEICATMRSQRDEQINYFTQRESSMKLNYEHQQSQLLKEKSEITAQLVQLQTEHLMNKDELDHLTDARNKWICQKNDLNNTIQEFEIKVRELQKEVQHQKNCASKINKDTLSASLSQMKIAAKKENQSLNKVPKNVKKIIDDYLETRGEIITSVNSRQVADLKKQLLDVKQHLQKEKEENTMRQYEITKLSYKLDNAKRKAAAGMQASLNSSRSLIQRTNLQTNSETVDDIFSNYDYSHDLQSFDGELPVSSESSAFELSSKSFDQVLQADRAAVEKLQNLSII